ncbi:MAG TPA: hypothetical protein VGF18_02535, partial [Candidatus Tumulicola sp.]
SPYVRYQPDAVFVDRLRIDDPAIVDYFAAMPPEKRANAAREAFVVGCRALAAAGGSATMSALDERLNAAVASASARLDDVPVSIGRHVDEVCVRYFGHDGRLVTQLGESVRDVVAADVRRRVSDALEPVVRALNVNDAAGPLGVIAGVLQEVRCGQIQLRTSIEGAFAAQRQRSVSVHKGYDLEDFVEASLGELASRLGDRFENCSRETGAIHNCKIGDFLSIVDGSVTRGPDARIVVEAKTAAVTVKKLCDELDAAMENRGATVGIGVLANPKSGSRPIALYGPSRIVVHLPSFGDPASDTEYHRTLLELAYSAARVQAAALAQTAPAESLDAAVVGEHVDRIDAAVKRFSELKRNFTAIESAVRMARQTADSVRAEIDDLAADFRSTLDRHAARLEAGARRALTES